MAYKERRQDMPPAIQQYLKKYGETGGDWRNYTDPETQKEWSHIQQYFPPPSSGDEIIDAEVQDYLDIKRSARRKKDTPGKPLLQHLAQQYPLGDEGNILTGREPFQMMKNGGSIEVDLDFDPFIDGLKGKIREEHTDIYNFLERNQDYGAVGGGILRLLSGKNVDLPPIERGDHSFGIRDIKQDFLENYPELFYMYGNEESPFNLEATVGGDERDKYMTVGGKFTFAGGGLASLLGY